MNHMRGHRLSVRKVDGTEEGPDASNHEVATIHLGGITMKKMLGIGLVTAALTVAGGIALAPASSAATCNLFTSGNITTGMCGNKPYFSQKFGKNTFGNIGGQQFNQFDVGGGMSVGNLGGRPMNCINVGVGFRNCY